MAQVYCGIVVPSGYYITKMALDYFKNDSYKVELGDEDRYISDYLTWSRDRLLREYISFLARENSFLYAKIEHITLLDEKMLENLLLNDFWDYTCLNLWASSYKLNNGAHIFIGHSLYVANILISFSGLKSDNSIKILKGNLISFGFTDFEIDVFFSNSLNISTLFTTEEKDRLP